MMLDCRADNPDRTCTSGRWSKIATLVRSGLIETGPSARPSNTATASTTNPIARDDRRNRAGAGDAVSVAMASARPDLCRARDDLLEQIDDARSPPRRDVGVEGDDVLALDGLHAVPSGPGRDRLLRLMATFRVGEVHKVRVPLHDVFRGQLRITRAL